MKVDFLIVGQGIAGSLLSYRLLQAGKRVMVLDDGHQGRASRVAGAVINSLSGKQWKPAPDAELFLPIAIETYRELEQLLQKQLIRSLPLYLFHTPGEPALPHLQPVSPQLLDPYFHLTGPLDCLAETFLVDAAALLDGWAARLQQQGALREDNFDGTQCTFGDEIDYRDIKAGAIIFCEGAAARTNPLLKQLPFTANRGEALLLDIPGLPPGAIYHREGLRLAPRSDGLFWCGSNYTWTFSDLTPDASWRDRTLAALDTWLRIPFQLRDHIVAERPTTAGQVPLLGVHPAYPGVFFLNGLGTRGFSAGPYWTIQLAQLLLQPGYRIPTTAGYVPPGKWLTDPS